MIGGFERGDSIYLEWTFFLRKECLIRFLLLIDTIRVIFIITVGLITLSVYLFRISYIINEKDHSRFHLLLFVFVRRIIILILRPRILRGLLGWDGLGLSSYLLVIFYNNNKAYSSGIITAITNRLGDVFIIIIISYHLSYRSWNIGILGEQSASKFWILVLILGTFTKSAQIPFSAWLPAAMAAPTPVSSLVHSSTLVTAGVYLLIRYNFWFSNNNFYLYMGFAGILTTFLARMAALIETDLKKIVALSTLSQLGLIVSYLGFSIPKLRFVHLIAHAFFKALIFIGTGRIIHSANQGQDLRFIGSSVKGFRFSKSWILLSNFRLIGLPFISAFFSKEILLEKILRASTSGLMVVVFYIRIFLTVIYATRFLSLFYSTSKKSSALIWIRESDYYITSSYLVLGAPAILGGLGLVNNLFNYSRALSVFRLYYTILIFRVIFLRGVSCFWGLVSFRRLSLFYKNQISMWGLRVVSYSLGVAATLHFPVLFKSLDSGAHSYLVDLIPKGVKTLISWRILRKSLQSLLIILLVWLVVGLCYYLNNRLSNLVL